MKGILIFPLTAITFFRQNSSPVKLRGYVLRVETPKLK